MIGKTILLAESDPETIKALSLRLKSENYELLVSSDALQGTRSVLENKPDLVIANAQVPGGGASAIHKQLQSRGDFTTPVVYLANCPDAALRSQADTMGAASFHTKPFDLDEILQEIHRILKNPAEAARVV
ncbi:MAG: response regulator, partial [Phycisphaerae bacterium]